MSITRGVFAQSSEPEAHEKVLDNNPDWVGIWKCWLLRRAENRSTRRKTSRSKDENQQQTQPTYDAESGNQTRATLAGGECSHHCDIPAPLKVVVSGCFCRWCVSQDKKLCVHYLSRPRFIDVLFPHARNFTPFCLSLPRCKMGTGRLGEVN